MAAESIAYAGQNEVTKVKQPLRARTPPNQIGQGSTAPWKLFAAYCCGGTEPSQVVIVEGLIRTTASAKVQK
jgi:hypothetical protein